MINMRNKNTMKSIEDMLKLMELVQGKNLTFEFIEFLEIP